MKILYFAVTRLQERYYDQLSRNLDCYGRVVHHSRLFAWGFHRPDEAVRKAITEGVESEMAVVAAKQRLWGKGPLGGVFKSLLVIRGYLQAYRYDRLLERERPDVVVLWNNRKSRQMLMAALAVKRGIRPVYFENGLLPGTTTVDWKGVNYDNSLPRDGKFYLQYRSDDLQLPSHLVSREAEMGKTAPGGGCDLPDTFLFVPFQVDYDSQIIIHSPWIKNMEAFAETVIEAAEGSGYTVVFKEHPSSEVTYPFLKQKVAGKKVLFANDCPTQELIERSSGIITVNSTVGLEGVLLGKKVVVLGNAFYRIEGLVKSASSVQELSEIVTGLEQWNPDDTLRKSFLNYLWGEYLIHPSWRTPTREHFTALNRRIGCGEKRTELYLVSTVLNLYNATLIALERSDKADAYLVFIDQTAAQADQNRDMIARWNNNPFVSVDYLITREGKGFGKMQKRIAELERLSEAVRSIRPKTIVTGNDRRIEFLKAMHEASVLYDVNGVYMDDGMFSYVEHTKPWWQETIFHRFFGMMVYGSWYRRWRTVGASPLLKQAYLAFPERADKKIAANKEVFALPIHRAKEKALRALSETMLKHPLSPEAVSVDVVVMIPHESLLRSDSALKSEIQTIITGLAREGKRMGIKNHPRNAPQILREICGNTVFEELPASVAFEILLPLLGHVKVIGAASTVLLSCRWLRPDVEVYYLHNDSKTVALYEQLGVKAWSKNI